MSRMASPRSPAESRCIGLRHALQALLLLDRFGAGVEVDHGRQEEGVEGAVVQARVDAAQAVAQRVHAAQAFLEGHSALHRGAHEVEPRLAVAAVAGGALDVAPGALAGHPARCRRPAG